MASLIGVEPRGPGYLPFSTKMAALGAAAVFATLIVLLIPVYYQGRANSTRLHGLRLSAIARSAAVALPAESLDVIGARGQNTEAFISARSSLSRLWRANSPTCLRSHGERESRRDFQVNISSKSRALQCENFYGYQRSYPCCCLFPALLSATSR